MHAVEGNAALPVARGPLIVCGMHRSGTSLTASVLAGAGLHLGDDLLPASAGNQRGHYEDLGILSFHRNVLIANGLLSEGYTTRSDLAIPARLRESVAAHVAARRQATAAWGWKEPRTTLFLDVWREMLPEARFLLVFRRPWEVVDSLLRRNEATFHWNPAFAIEVWLHYNRCLLDFAERHPGETLVCELTQIAASPDTLVEAIRARFGLGLAGPAASYEPALLRQDIASSRPPLLAAACPEAYALYLRLRDLAGSASPLPDVSGSGCGDGELPGHIFLAWGQATQHMLRCHEAEERLREAEAGRLAAERRLDLEPPRPANRLRPWRRLLSSGRRRSKAA